MFHCFSVSTLKLYLHWCKNVLFLPVQMLPLQFYVYCLLPELIWWAVAQHWTALMAAISHVRRSMGLQRLLMFVVFHVIGIEILVSIDNIYALHDTLPSLDPVNLVLCYNTGYAALSVCKMKYFGMSIKFSLLLSIHTDSGAHPTSHPKFWKLFPGT